MRSFVNCTVCNFFVKNITYIIRKTMVSAERASAVEKVGKSTLRYLEGDLLLLLLSLRSLNHVIAPFSRICFSRHPRELLVSGWLLRYAFTKFRYVLSRCVLYFLRRFWSGESKCLTRTSRRSTCSLGIDIYTMENYIINDDSSAITSTRLYVRS